jgi:hypothetical protein
MFVQSKVYLDNLGRKERLVVVLHIKIPKKPGSKESESDQMAKDEKIIPAVQVTFVFFP